MVFAILTTFAYLALHAPPSAATPVQVLERAHAHNDYEHKRPLLDALDQGFCSVEADVFLVDGKLLVGHSRKELTPERTFEKLYLVPLSQRAKQYSGWTYPGYYKPFYVLVDIKENGAEVYKVFKNEIQSHPELRSVRYVISGDRPIAAIVADNGRYGLDGRWSDLDKGYSPAVMPWISEDWSTHFKWSGEGTMPAAEYEKLLGMVKAAHSKGYKLRFWGTPDRESVWEIEWRAGVDWINTDRLADVHAWMLPRLSGGRQDPN